MCQTWRVPLLVVVPKLCLQRVGGQDDGLLVVAPEPPLDHVKLELEEVVVAGHLVLEKGNVVHVEPWDLTQK